MTSRLLRLPAVAASVLLLSGCTSMFAPDPTMAPISISTPPSTPIATDRGAACTPDNVSFDWSDPYTLPYALLQATYQSYDRAGAQTGGGSFGPAYGTLVELEPQGIFSALGGALDSWESTAAARAASSGLLADGFDHVQYLVDGSAFDVAHARSAMWIRGVVARQVSVEYAATCPDGTVFSGTLTGFDSNNSREYTLNCDADGARESAAQKVVRKACSEARA